VGSERGGAVTAPPPAPEDSVRRDAITRQLMAIRRAEREGEAVSRTLEARGRDFERHEHEVIEQLRAAGYLQEHGGGRRRH
jgi:hypothetical protein